MEKKLDEILTRLTITQKSIRDLLTKEHFKKEMDEVSARINDFVDLHLKLDQERLESLKNSN